MEGSANHWRRAPRHVPLGVVSVVGALICWQLVSDLEIVPSRHVPPFSAVASSLWHQLGGSPFWSSVGETVKSWALGLGIATGLAVPIGILIATSWVAYRATRVVVEFCRPIPSVALIPLAVILFGTGTSMSVFLVAFGAFWPLLANTIYGVCDVDNVLLDTGRAFGVPRRHRLVRITFPSAVPYIATGFRISSAIALILTITSELVAGSGGGLGEAIGLAQSGGAVTGMYALILATGVIAVLINFATRALERRALHWHPAHRAV
jgi:ABC-type nitrate/sulfonate/bicarbonate transport system permease component